MKKVTIGLMGTGRFAQVLDALFARDPAWVVRHSSRTRPVDGEAIVSIEQLAQCDIIIPAVPISAFADVLSELIPHISPGKQPLIVSVCSVMKEPEMLMMNMLPEAVDILVSHPLFGPHSTKNGTNFSQFKWAWCPIRVQDQVKLERLKQFLIQQQLQLVDIDSDTHDQLMSNSQLLSFLVGYICREVDLKPTPLDTPSVTELLRHQAIIQTNSQQLVEDLITHNQHAANKLQQVLRIIQRLIAGSQPTTFDSLEEMRQRIDQLDQQLLLTLKQRMEVVQQVGEFKHRHQLAPLQPDRWRAVLAKLDDEAKQIGVPTELVHDLWNRIHQAALQMESAV